MNIEKHLKIAGGTYLVLGGICFALTGYLIIRDVYWIYRSGWESMDNLISARLCKIYAILLASSCLDICIGLGLSKQKRWATRVVGFIVAALSLFAFPIGTVLGGYTLWILIRIDKQEALMT